MAIHWWVRLQGDVMCRSEAQAGPGNMHSSLPYPTLFSPIPTLRHSHIHGHTACDPGGCSFVFACPEGVAAFGFEWILRPVIRPHVGKFAAN